MTPTTPPKPKRTRQAKPRLPVLEVCYKKLTVIDPQFPHELHLVSVRGCGTDLDIVHNTEDLILRDKGDLVAVFARCDLVWARCKPQEA